MFTGIIEGKGRISSVNKTGRGRGISVEAPFGLYDDRIGDSIAVNGICLTITDIKGNIFSADVSEETISRTNLGKVTIGDKVNLERALKLGDRMGGHMVTGHIDSIGKVKVRERKGDSVHFEIKVDPLIIRHVVEKGSVAVDGVSMTVNGVGNDFFAMNVIPHTLEITTLGLIKQGDTINVETDIIGKYVERLMHCSAGSGGVDMDLLKACGFT